MLGICLSLIRSHTPPLDCFGVVLSHATTLLIAKTQAKLRLCIALIGSLAEPFNCLGITRFSANNILIVQTKVALGMLLTLLCRCMPPFYRFGFVLRHTGTIIVANAKTILRHRISLLRLFLQRFYIRRITCKNESKTSEGDEQGQQPFLHSITLLQRIYESNLKAYAPSMIVPFSRNSA